MKEPSVWSRIFAWNLEPNGLGMVNQTNRKITVPFVAWNTRNFKPEYLVEWKAPEIDPSAALILTLSLPFYGLPCRLQSKRRTITGTVASPMANITLRFKTRYKPIWFDAICYKTFILKYQWNLKGLLFLLYHVGYFNFEVFAVWNPSLKTR